MLPASQTRLRILYAINVLAVGGAELFLLRKMQMFKERGHFAALAYCEKKGEKIDFFLKHYLNDRDLYCVEYDFDLIQPLTKNLAIDIVHTVQGHPYFLRRAKENDSRMICVSTQTPEIWKADQAFNHRLYTDAFVVKSEIFRNVVLKMIRRPAQFIATIPNGVVVDGKVLPEARQKAIRISLGVPEDKKIIFQIGRIHPVKNLEDSMTIARKLCELRNDCIFLVAGGHKGEMYEKYFNELNAQRDGLSLKDQYLFLGERTDVNDLIAISHCVLCTTKLHEGTPNSLLEAMSVGKPIVAFKCPGISDVIQHKVTGFLSEGVEDAIEYLNALLDDAMLCKTMGLSGREYCKERFDLNLAVSNYEKFYRELLSRQTNGFLRTARVQWNRFQESAWLTMNRARQNR